MNISLAPKKKKGKNQKSIGYGLNNRGSSTSAASSSNVFGEDNSSSEDEDDGQMTNRNRVNQQIIKEQVALRKRAEAATASMESSVYDYDGAYDSFHKADSSSSKQQNQAAGERKSRYIEDLLKNSKKRERERDAINERKIAKEQAEEDAQADYQGKEKFITKAYKRKLEERKQWERKEKEKEREEEDNDVRKKTVGAAFGSFYGNFSRNVAMGGKEKDVQKEESVASSDVKPDGGGGGGLGFLSGFERTSSGGDEHEMQKESMDATVETKSQAVSIEDTKVPPALPIRQIREKKVQEARKRYLERKKTEALQ
jgi:coiled-coil domain-containing protein 55